MARVPRLLVIALPADYGFCGCATNLFSAATTLFWAAQRVS
jgi:hypothetical protein